MVEPRHESVEIFLTRLKPIVKPGMTNRLEPVESFLTGLEPIVEPGAFWFNQNSGSQVGSKRLKIFD